MKNEKWEDVTRETKIEHFAGGNGIAIRLTGGGLLSRGGTVVNREGMRWSWVNDFDICIERRVKAPEFKWTPESVAAIDWLKKSDIETLEACVEHYDEQIEAGNYGCGKAFSYSNCPACQKWYGEMSKSCYICPLMGESETMFSCCCGKWNNWNEESTRKNALAVRDYIAKKLEELRKPKKPEFKLGDRVRHKAFGGGFTIVATFNGGGLLIFNPTWREGHHGGGSFVRGSNVAGYEYSHWIASENHLTHECEKVSK